MKKYTREEIMETLVENQSMESEYIGFPKFDESVIRPITQEEFQERIKKHDEWLADRNTGERANFKNIDFSHRQFDNMNLEYAEFRNCYFSYNHFKNCNCKYITIETAKVGVLSGYDSDFTGAFLLNINGKEINFSRCNLKTANIEDIKVNNFDLTGSKLDDTEFSGLSIENLDAQGTKFIDVKGLVVLGVQWTDGYNNNMLYYIPKYDVVSAGTILEGYSCTMEEFEEELEEYEEEGTLSVSYRHYEKDKETLIKAKEYLKEEAKRLNF